MTAHELASLRHALRTPLNHIIGYAEILRDEASGSPDARCIESLDEIVAAARRILEQVQTILTPGEPGEDRVGRLRTSLIGPIGAIRSSLACLSEPGNPLAADDVARIEAATATLECFAQGGAIEEAPVAHAPAEPSPIIGARVLVVDDDESNRLILRRMLRRDGFEVSGAPGGREALERLRREPFDLVLLDLVMPGMDGFEVLKTMQADSRLRTIPVVMLSASDELGGIVRSLEMGAEDFVPKPFDPVLLRVRMAASLRRKRAEEECARLAESFRLLLDSSGEGIYGVDAEGLCTFVNRAALDMLGFSREQLIGRPLHERIHHTRPDGTYYPYEKCPVRKVLLTGEPSRVSDEYLYRDDGTAVPVVYSAHPIVKGGQVRGAVVTISDISERKRNEDRLREAARLESLGVLAGGIAHDFNNLLTGIMGNASLAIDTLEPDHDGAALLQEVIRASERAAGLTSQMLAFAGKGRYLLRALDLTELVRNMTDLLRTSLPKKAGLELRLASGVPPVHADAQQMQQLVLNLAINAGEAIDDRVGKVTIETGILTVDGSFPAEPGFEPALPGEYVYLSVADTGAGMDQATRTRIFDPFFTTKFTGRGLGLPASMGIVRSHGGVMRVETEPGSGSRFLVLLPAQRSSEHAA